MKTETKNIISADLFRIHGNVSKKAFKKCMTYPGFKFLYFLRKCQAAQYKPLKYFYRIILGRLSIKFGFQILPRTKIGKGFRIYHFGNIIINPNAEIGEYCAIYPNVVIGNIDYGKKKGTPKIGDKVWIGANSVIVGNISIGNDVLIAPGAYINFNVPTGSVVIGNPGKIIPKKNPTIGYIENVLIEEASIEK